jgi:hypothetical protein
VLGVHATLRDSVRVALTTQHSIVGKAFEQSRVSLAELQARQRRVFEMREDGTYSSEEFRERLGAVEAQIAVVKGDLAHVEIPSINLDRAFESLNRFCLNLRKHWHDLPVRARVRFEQLLLPKGVAYDRDSGIRTPELGPVFRMLCDAAGPLSLSVDWRGDRLNQVVDSLNEAIGLDRELTVLLSDNQVANHIPSSV